MADFRHVGLLLLSLVLLDAASMFGKDMYCRDPDTGKLHTINSTWASKSFCGHYTCRLRKRNISETENTPIRIINITNIHNRTANDGKVKNILREDLSVTEPKQSKDNAVTETIQSETTEIRATELLQNEFENIVSESTENDKTSQSETTTNENINTIDINTFTTPKSYINVIKEKRTEPEIKEVHKNVTAGEAFGSNIKSVVTDGTLQKPEENSAEVAEFLSKIANNKEDRYLTEQEIKSISEVLHTVKKSDLDAIVDIYNLAQDIYNEMDKTLKQGAIDDAIDNMGHENLHKILKPSYFYDPIRVPNKGRDMNFQSSHQVPTTIEPKPVITALYNGAMPNQEYGKLPYYYPMSLFQRSSSYIQPTQPTNIERPTPCKHRTRNMQTDQSGIKPSYLLPYPFAYIPRSNHTDYQNYPYYPPTYYYPWADYNRQQMRQYQPYYNTYIAQVPAAVPKAVLTNPYLTGDTDVVLSPVNNNVGNIVATAEKEVVPEWKTEELSKKILDEVRANFDTPQILKAFPLRKKVKLEKVGKLIKLENLERFRRDADDKLTVIHKDEPHITMGNNVKTVLKDKVIDNVKPVEKNRDVTEIVKEITEAKNKQVRRREELHSTLMNKVKTLVNKIGVTNTPKEASIAKAKLVALEALTTGEPVTEEGEYETFIEKKMCETHTEPGYFRVGNLSQPYPRCCPQLINNR